ncbi:MAG: BMP family ABC transporter substrate-binding protein, partial [Anaerolineae bacterium]
MRKWTLISLLVLVALFVAPASVFAQGETEYTVQLDDNLWNIAEKYFETGVAYRAILLATNLKSSEDPTFARIEDRSLIYPGQKLLIPGADEAEEMLAMLRGFRVGYVTDTGGIDDKSFNTNQWEGIQRAVQELGVEAQFIQSDEATQYEANLTEFASQGYD